MSDYLAPRNPHPDSILWRSTYTPLNARGDILHEQAQYWGQRGIHYHQFLRAGENTLNLQLGRVLIESLIARGRYDAEDYLRRYLEFMLTPGRHRDTYVEECHRKFFTAYAQGTPPRKCGGRDIHIGGLGLRSRIGVLLYDAMTAFAPLEEAKQTAELLRDCLTVWNEWDAPGGRFHFEADTNFYFRWGVKMTAEERALLETHLGRS